MLFHEIIEKVQKTHTICDVIESNPIPVTHVKLLTGQPFSWDDHSLYIGHYAQGLVFPDFPIQVIFCQDNTVSKDGISSQTCTSIDDFSTLKFKELEISHNIAFVKDCDMASFFNEINEMVFEDFSYTAHYTALLSMNLSNESLQTIVDAASDMAGNPLIILDSSYKILCSSTNYPIKDLFWTDNIKRGYCTYEFILAVNDLFAEQGGNSNGRDAYPITCPVSPYTKVFCNLIWHQSLIGYLIMLDSNQSVFPWHYRLLPKISESVCITLSKLPNFKGIHGSMKETILFQLLNGENEMNIDVRMKTAGLAVTSFMKLLTVQFDSYSDNTIVKPYIKEQLLLLFPSAYLTEYEGSYVVLIPFSNKQDFSAKQKDGLSSLFQNAHLKIACSDFFTSFFHAKIQYQLCLDLISSCCPLQTSPEVIYFSNFRFYYLLSQITDKNLLASVLHPALSILSNYDLENGTSLYETLSMYLIQNCSLKDTASALFIHRNSLSYRLEKIIELTHVDLKNTEECFQLNCSYRIEKHLQKL